MLLLLVVVVVPVAAIAFARSGRGYAEIGKGRFGVDYDQSGDAEQREEVRQLVEAKAYRQARRGEQPVDVEAEIERLLNGEPEPAPVDARPAAGTEPATGPEDPESAQIRAEIRQVVTARNESRARRGEKPLDVEAEIERILSEFG